MSLGGFRIAPADRTNSEGYDNDREAMGLAVGMEEKIYWSRLIRAGGPLGLPQRERIVGGKCVLLPSPEARIGQPRDFELLDFAIAAFKDFESSSGILLTTGQDLGHGTMSDGRTPSLVYLNDRFKGSVLADTSRPTAEGNFHLLRGMLRAMGIGLPSARIALIGCGNIGMHLLRRLLNEGAEVIALEAVDARRAQVASLGVETFAPSQKGEFLRRPVDAIAVNASGGSLDAETVAAIAANPRTRIVCGCENLAMPDPAGVERLRHAETLYAPTEFGGMMGYLTAVEEYLSVAAGIDFDVETMLQAAGRLEVAGFEATDHAVESRYEVTFAAAVKRVFGDR
jgi:hypothetical protein